MNDSDQKMYDRLVGLYESGDVPWDAQDPPPEVIDFLATVPPGHALDLGCGYGRAAIYMASLGWGVDAIDFIPEAIAEATRRAADAQVEVQFHLSKVSDLGFLNGTYDFALDVGCSHNMANAELNEYRDHLQRLIRPGGIFLLFARLKDDSSTDPQNGPAGMNPDYLGTIYGNGFELEWMERGYTQVGDDDGWISAWFRFRRT